MATYHISDLQKQAGMGSRCKTRVLRAHAGLCRDQPGCGVSAGCVEFTQGVGCQSGCTGSVGVWGVSQSVWGLVRMCGVSQGVGGVSRLYIHTMEYYSAMKKNTSESVLMMWTKLETIIQSESQKEKYKYCVLTHIYGI